jgi:hypothetical protein
LATAILTALRDRLMEARVRVDTLIGPAAGPFNANARLELFPFRYRDRLTGKWVKARYVAERHEIAARYGEWEIIGPPEIRNVDTHERYFSPWKGSKSGPQNVSTT